MHCICPRARHSLASQVRIRWVHLLTFVTPNSMMPRVAASPDVPKFGSLKKHKCGKTRTIFEKYAH